MMKKNKPKVALIGAGGMARYHIEGFREGGADVVAVCDLNLAAAEDCAKKFSVSAVYTSADEMIAAEKLDAVSVLTPNAFHAPMALKALKNSLHVYCEKPPALNAKETLAMARAAERAKKRLMFGFCNRARPESAALRKEIISGRFGKIDSAQALWVRRTGIPGYGGWFTTKAVSGGGPLIDLLHGIDLALWFMGYPKGEYALARTFDTLVKDRRFRGPWGIPTFKDGVCDVESASHAFVTLEGGACLTLRCSWAEMVQREVMSLSLQGALAGADITRKFAVDGDDATAEDTSFLYKMSSSGKRIDKILTDKRDEAMGRVRCAANFVRTILGKEEPLSTPEEAVALMKIVDAVYMSARKGVPVKI
jgi:predicted dehydrogenase